MRSHRSARTAFTAIALALPLALAACGGDASSAGTSTTSMSSSSSSSSTASAMGGMTAPFGPGCAAVPMSGKGSFDGMSTEAVATAASNNPLLTTLVAAVGKAGLGDTLNNAKAITVFAPTDDAFAALDKATLDKAMADPKGLLTTVLTNHVVEGRLAPDALAGTHTTLAGTKITVSGSGESFMVGEAKVICGNVQTANATVYILDRVLLPAS